MNSKKLFDVEFSLAIYNRTGKYFIGKDIIDSCSELLGDTWYWYYRSPSPPAGLFGKVIGRIQHLQVIHTALGGPFGLIPKRMPKRPLLHIDPLSVLSTHLGPKDAVICHDVGPITHPYLFDAKTGPIYDAIYKHVAAVGPHVIFVSKATQTAFNSMYSGARLSSQRIIFPAIRHVAADGKTSPVEGLDGPFLLTVGALGMRKNQVRAMKAFQKLGLAERGVKYVLCGAREPGYDDVLKAASSTPGVVILQYVPDDQLAWLYKNTKGFVLPSLLEGFGMPVAEAIRYGVVPLVSAGSVLEEVAGIGALSVDPENESTIAAAMIALIDMSDAERNARRARLSESILRFSDDAIARHWRAALSEMAA